jgi:hypothetical protein
VSVFDAPNYGPPSARLAGFASGAPRELDLRDAGGENFVGRIDSIVVGPGAEVVAYAQKKPAGVELLLKPGTRIPDLNVVNFRNRIDALKVRCLTDANVTARAQPPLFASLDRNGDGRLDRAELNSPNALAGDWIVMDRDGDGLITPEEFTTITAQR